MYISAGTSSIWSASCSNPPPSSLPTATAKLCACRRNSASRAPPESIFDAMLRPDDVILSIRAQRTGVRSCRCRSNWVSFLQTFRRPANEASSCKSPSKDGRNDAAHAAQVAQARSSASIPAGSSSSPTRSKAVRAHRRNTEPGLQARLHPQRGRHARGHQRAELDGHVNVYEDAAHRALRRLGRRMPKSVRHPSTAQPPHLRCGGAPRPRRQSPRPSSPRQTR